MSKTYGDPAHSDWLLFQPVDEHDSELMPAETEIIRKMCPETALAIITFQVDWFNDLTPWPARSVFKGQPDFGNGAEKLLQQIVSDVVPEVKSTSREQKLILGGYSLAGLFALWTAYQTYLFSGIVAASPSVWYPDWMEYAQANRVKTSALYLSLGDREERTRNPVMRAVGDNIRKQYELLKAQGIPSKLTWNEGNHFVDSEKRTAAGFAWIINTITAIGGTT